MSRADDFSVDVQAARPEGFESLIPILQGLTRFLSRFHVRQHDEKTVCPLRADSTTAHANYFQKSIAVSTAFLPDSEYTNASPFENSYKFLNKQAF